MSIVFKFSNYTLCRKVQYCAVLCSKVQLSAAQYSGLINRLVLLFPGIHLRVQWDGKTLNLVGVDPNITIADLCSHIELTAMHSGVTTEASASVSVSVCACICVRACVCE